MSHDCEHNNGISHDTSIVKRPRNWKNLVSLNCCWSVWMRYLKEFYRFLKHLLKSKSLILTLSYGNIKEQYLGSYLGILWALLRPALFIGIIWFIFGVGFKSRPTDDGSPFILWLLCGFVPWFFFAEAMTRSMRSIVTNASFVKKVAFRVSVLPLINVFSALFIHFILLFILLTIFMIYGYYPTVYWIQIPYYTLCITLLVTGLGWLISALRVFIKDIGEIIGVLIQFGFWLTPIFWNIDILPVKYQTIIKLNPMFYVVDGYRGALIHKEWFWENYILTSYFLAFSGITIIVGAVIFKRLRPHFGDVL